jgi:hypothetical protein
LDRAGFSRSFVAQNSAFGGIVRKLRPRNVELANKKPGRTSTHLVRVCWCGP